MEHGRAVHRLPYLIPENSACFILFSAFLYDSLPESAQSEVVAGLLRTVYGRLLVVDQPETFK